MLGPDARLRFIPTHFNARNQALDAMGVPCTDIACPHCRRKLPPSFLELPNRIISLVGAPSAGKSYYLCALIKTLPAALYKNFALTFRDGDPSGNAYLNAMKNQLFSARSPSQAYISKTDFEGAMYEKFPRHGKTVALPRPFVYALAPLADAAQSVSLIFYDNAGEHFNPNISIEDSPGALHVASSAGVLFLLDPTSSPAFRARLTDGTDPQLAIASIDQQDSILSEMAVRIRLIAGLDARARLEKPLALIIGKCDVWRHLLPASSPLENPVRTGSGSSTGAGGGGAGGTAGVLDLDIVERNSETIRDFLLETDAAIVAAAESVSANIRYFAVSSFDHSPVPIPDGPNAGKLAPDPVRLRPFQVEIPLLWVLAQTDPNLVPVCKN